MARRVFIVDGHNLLFRSFFGIPARIPGSNGQSIHAVMGFIGTLLSACADFEPTHMAVVFDHEQGSFRDQLDGNYKSNRIRDWSDSAIEDNPFSQLVHITRVLDHIGWRHFEIPGFEADDVIAAYVRDCAESAEAVMIMSTDSDLLQLVGPTVSVCHRRGKKPIIYSRTQVEEKYGVPPQLIPDMKALTGDTTDNLAGVPGVGLKTAQGLIVRFGGIPEIFESLDAIESERLREKLILYRERVLHNLSMTRLDQPVILPAALAELSIQPESWQHKTMGLLREIGITR